MKSRHINYYDIFSNLMTAQRSLLRLLPHCAYRLTLCRPVFILVQASFICTYTQCSFLFRRPSFVPIHNVHSLFRRPSFVPIHNVHSCSGVLHLYLYTMFILVQASFICTYTQCAFLFRRPSFVPIHNVHSCSGVLHLYLYTMFILVQASFICTYTQCSFLFRRPSFVPIHNVDK